MLLVCWLELLWRLLLGGWLVEESCGCVVVCIVGTLDAWRMNL